MTTRTGPQRYPGANTAYWYGTKYPGSAMEVNVVVLHTTEGRSLPDYGGGASAPTLTALPDLAARKLRWYQHFQIDTSARALVNAPGGVETNTLNVCQVELVGTCDQATHAKWERAGQPHVYWPEAPEWALQEVARFLGWMHTQHGVPLSGPSSWPSYPGSYGATRARMTGEQWTKFRGVCGHMHVPENTHGDPGSIDFTRLLDLAREDDEPPATPPTTPPTKPTHEPYPGTSFFTQRDGKPALGKSSPIFTAMGRRLVAVGCGRYKVGPGPVLGQADVDSYEAWQRKCGYSGTAAKWPPGPDTWTKLRVPNV